MHFNVIDQSRHLLWYLFELTERFPARAQRFAHQQQVFTRVHRRVGFAQCRGVGTALRPQDLRGTS